MTVTYHHDHDRSRANPAPLTYTVIETAAGALDAGARKMGPLARTHDIMGAKLSPSAEIFAQGAGTLEVDYSDGRTRTFDIDATTGQITPRRYAYAFALVVEFDEPITEEMTDDVNEALCHAFPRDRWRLEYASGPESIPLNTGDYDVQPRDETAGGRNR